MRVGDSKSLSYRRLQARRAARKVAAVNRLCTRLDRLVARGERLKSGKTRAELLGRAEVVREKLRKLDH
jgi:hypothetical protein